MSPDADPNNPAGKYFYFAHAQRDWYEDALEQEREKWKDNPSHARVFWAERIDR